MLLLVVVAAAARIDLALQPGLWADEIFSLAMATGHSLEHPAATADLHFGDYVETAAPQPRADWQRYTEHATSNVFPDGIIRAVFRSDTSPPLYYLLLYAWTRLCGTSDAALRLFSVLWAMACFPLLWSLTRRIDSRHAAWVALTLFAAAPAALYYAAEGRMYALTWVLRPPPAPLTLPFFLLGGGAGGGRGRGRPGAGSAVARPGSRGPDRLP